MLQKYLAIGPPRLPFPGTATSSLGGGGGGGGFNPKKIIILSEFNYAISDGKLNINVNLKHYLGQKVNIKEIKVIKTVHRRNNLKYSFMKKICFKISRQKDM